MPPLNATTTSVANATATAPKSVCIVGAGFAGLAVARTLLSHSPSHLTVTCLEATDAVGGRARCGQLAAGPVELGATCEQ